MYSSGLERFSEMAYIAVDERISMKFDKLYTNVDSERIVGEFPTQRQKNLRKDSKHRIDRAQ